MNRLIALDEVAEINPRIPRVLAKDSLRTVSFVPMSAVSEEGQLSEFIEKPLGEVLSGFTYFQRGDTLLAKITPCMENGKAAHVSNLPHYIGFGSTEFHVLRPGPKIDGRYLFYMIWNPLFRFEAKHRMTGAAGQQRVPTDFIKSYKIPLPPLDEQRRIADILDKADAIRRKRQESIRMTDEFLCSTFLEMFGEPVKNPKGWPLKTLRELGEVKTGRTPLSNKTGMFGGKIPFITPGDLENKGEIKRYVTEDGAAEVVTVRAGAALVCCIGATIGKMGKAKQLSAFNQQINAIEWEKNEINDDYGINVLNFFKAHIAASSTSTTLPILKKSAFEKIKIPVPPYHLQSIFAQRLSNIEKINSSNCFSLEYIDSLFNSLVQKAVRGELS